MAKLGIQNGKLSPCPDSPNCVSTHAIDSKQKMGPLLFSGNTQMAKERLLKAVKSFPRTRVIKDEANYLHVTFTSGLFRFVDDVEFLINEVRGVIDFRSASRVGYSDLGANRKRMEKFRKVFEK